MKPNIGLHEAQRDGVIRILTGVLADLHVLYIKTRNYHWNVSGPNFSELHEFFGAQYAQLATAGDDVAERIRALGGHSPGSMAEFLQAARLKEQPPQAIDAATMITSLLADHETVIRQLRGDAEKCASEFGDTGTNDFLIGLLEDHEKLAWMLRAAAGK